MLVTARISAPLVEVNNNLTKISIKGKIATMYSANNPVPFQESYRERVEANYAVESENRQAASAFEVPPALSRKAVALVAAGALMVAMAADKLGPHNSDPAPMPNIHQVEQGVDQNLAGRNPADVLQPQGK